MVASPGRLRALAPLALLGVALAALAFWRAACVLAGPDVDTDAYAHHMIARQILADPHDLAVHWVWLPLFHYAQVPLVWLGGSMQAVRWTNVVLAAASPLLLFAYIARGDAPSKESSVPRAWVALVAALIAGACPIVMQMGTTAQPEPLFALIVLALAIALERRRYPAAAALLAVAVMLRYEAWAVVGMLVALLPVEAYLSRRRERPVPAGEPRAWLVVGVPVVAILVWAALRKPVDGVWFGFLHQTREFANDALHQTSSFQQGLLRVADDSTYYAWSVALRVLGPTLPLVPFGVARTLRQQGHRFVLVFVACLGFVTLTWIMRSSLGLDRHFVVVVPLYATLAAQGLATIADFFARTAAHRWPRASHAPRIASAIAAGLLALGALGGLGARLHVWMGHWRGALEHGFPDRVAVGAYLRSVPVRATIFCDEATVEILSGIDRRRFDRHWMDDSHTWELIDEAADRDGETYVATWAHKMKGHEPAGDLVFRPDDTADSSAGLAVMRVRRQSGLPRAVH
jgi:hypothetical protein